MEKRNVNLIIGKSGGTAAGNAKTYKISLPTNWVRRLGLTDTSVEMCFDGEKITLTPKLSSKMFVEKKTEQGHELFRIDFYDKAVLCTTIYADFTEKSISVENFTSNVIKTAFGNCTSPDWEDFESFLEERCVPRNRSGIREYLEALGLIEYDPWEIVKKTQGRMAEDHQWLKIEKII